ncbi:hypothetical protein [Aidingimonas halophila]|uniref:Uncharacterized protein n=1 Tax=Aidingimonas halophila TaxID=574349 RepID=A0A1H3F3C4_9GAMM|nr:hypothetical protein [Aidingimonas halophila]GHC32182.1 hypothetical protein GCM10008094_26120 [Aidingimonas halophila]SDX84858.1 hypothetical protein SAMN05443545_107321 [Aidingimonas halophila]
MQDEGISNWLGERIGEALRFVIDLLSLFFANIHDGVERFVTGLTDALGISPTLFSLIFLLIGLWLLYRGVRALLSRRFVGGLIWLFAAMIMLSWLVG